MRTSLNLSSKPFSNHRVYWLGVTLVFLVSFWFGLWIAAEKASVSAQVDELTSRLAAQAEEIARIEREIEEKKQAQQERQISIEDRIELVTAQRLIEMKAFSWNRMIRDFEPYVPKNTRILSIRVGNMFRLGRGVGAMVEVKALGKSADQMTEMMTMLQESGELFTIGQVSQDAGTDGGEVPFTLTLTYNPARERSND